MPFEKGNNVGKQFTTTYRPKNTGRKKKMATLLKGVPDDMQQKIFSILARALTMKSKDEAAEFINASSEDLGEYGLTAQIVFRELIGKRSWQTFNDICDRLFGKPKQSTDVTTNGEPIRNATIIYRDAQQDDKQNQLREL